MAFMTKNKPKKEVKKNGVQKGKEESKERKIMQVMCVESKIARLKALGWKEVGKNNELTIMEKEEI